MPHIVYALRLARICGILRSHGIARGLSGWEVVYDSCGLPVGTVEDRAWALRMAIGRASGRGSRALVGPCDCSSVVRPVRPPRRCPGCFATTLHALLSVIVADAAARASRARPRLSARDPTAQLADLNDVVYAIRWLWILGLDVQI